MSGFVLPRRRLALLSAFAVLAAGLVCATSVDASATTAACTITGTARNDTLRGTAGRDVICGLGGNDTISGLGGNDVILGGPGNDRIDGGAGNDTVNGDEGADTINGGDGNDTVSGDAGVDTINGSDGADALTGGEGNDTLAGDSGADTVNGGDGADRAEGGVGNDIVNGGDGSDTLNGGEGNDTVAGDSGADTVNGGDGNDTLNGGTADDSVTGGRGDDTLDAGAGNDTAQGSDGDDAIQGGTGDDRLRGDAGDDVIWGSSGLDALGGGTGNDALQGGAGKDSLTTGGGTDQCAIDTEDPVTGRCQTDSTGPTLSVVASPTQVVAGQVARFEWRASDPSGIQSTQVSIGGRSGWITSWCGFQVVGTLVSGNERDGVYAFECAIPANAPSQTYSFIASASDNFGFGADVASVDFTVVGGSSDVSVPAISEFQAPEVAERGKPFTVRWRTTDETGVAYAYGWVNFNVYNVVNVATMKSWVEYVDAPKIISGDAVDGVWEQTFTFRDDSPAGVYTFWFSLGDTLGNRDYSRTSYTIALAP